MIRIAVSRMNSPMNSGKVLPADLPPARHRDRGLRRSSGADCRSQPAFQPDANHQPSRGRPSSTCSIPCFPGNCSAPPGMCARRWHRAWLSRHTSRPAAARSALHARGIDPKKGALCGYRAHRRLELPNATVCRPTSRAEKTYGREKRTAARSTSLPRGHLPPFPALWSSLAGR